MFELHQPSEIGPFYPAPDRPAWPFLGACAVPRPLPFDHLTAALPYRLAFWLAPSFVLPARMLDLDLVDLAALAPVAAFATSVAQFLE